MPLDTPTEARRLDPHRALAEDPLAAPMLSVEEQQPAIQHIRSRDPRARLEQASHALHGRPAGVARDEAAQRQRRNSF